MALESKATRSKLRQALGRYRSAFVTIGVISAVLNVLLLGGSIYMMLVYDSVLPSHSIPTLIALLVLVIGVYAFQGVFDTVRSRILGDVANGFDRDISPPVRRAVLEARRRGVRLPGDGLSLIRDLDQIRGFISGPGPAAFIDLPWIAFFLAVLFLLHVWLGLTALIGAIVLIGVTLLTDRQIKEPTAVASQAAAQRNGMAESSLRHVELFAALGMQSRMDARWDLVNATHRVTQSRLARIVSTYGGVSKISRMILQSLILTVGALLVIDGQATGGVIFASSIISGRALAPVDQAIANWRSFAAARLGWHRLNELLAQQLPGPQSITQLPRPTAELTVQHLSVGPPGVQRVTVQNVSFRLKAGDGLGIIGASAAGKTSLGRALIGVWPALRGSVRLDGATLDQWPADTLGAFIGYLPQTVELLDGTVAENIGRFEPDASSDAVIAAARAAQVHDMIVQLPQGYETPVGADGAALSAGQRQRIGLARALYGDPFLVLLDEPNSNLDAAGEDALERAIAGIRVRGGIVIVIAHRQSALAQVSHVLFMRDGQLDLFGPRDEVLARAVARSLPGRNVEPIPAHAIRKRA